MAEPLVPEGEEAGTSGNGGSHVEVIRRHKHRPTVEITRDMLEELCLKYPQHEAAKVVGCGLTRFKMACRALGFTSWPHRRRKSVQALLENIVDAEEDAASEVVRILQAEDEALLKQPDKKLCPNFKKLRQAYYKEKYHTSRRDGGSGNGSAEAGAMEGMEEGDAEN